jgi:hypothetical protein
MRNRNLNDRPAKRKGPSDKEALSNGYYNEQLDHHPANSEVKRPKIASDDLCELLHAMRRAQRRFSHCHGLSFAILSIEHHLCDLLFRREYPLEEAKEAIRLSVKMAFAWFRYLERRGEIR